MKTVEQVYAEIIGIVSRISDETIPVEGAYGRVLAEGTVEQLCTRTGTANLRAAFFALVDAPEGARAS